jgi:hypothetical protein
LKSNLNKNYLISFFALIIFFSCKPEEDKLDIPKISSVEKLIEHSNEFEQNVFTYETPGGKVHFAIGFGIANSIMVEGEEEILLLIPQIALMKHQRFIRDSRSSMTIQSLQ